MSEIFLTLKRAAAAAASCACLVLAGCTSTPSIEGQVIEMQRPATRNLQALMEAPDRKHLSCRSIDPLSAQHALNDIVFACEELDVQATIIEMRDAGWRLVSVDVGSETTRDGVVEMPLTITIIKLF